jgi:3D (Asp-Asp-Asp) domain-containing protein
LKLLLLTIILTWTCVIEARRYETYIATAYALRGKTASGEKVRQGIIAADPKVLPLGSKVEIKGMGVFVVKDTGRHIKGRRIDIWMPSVHQARKFGRRKVQLKRL